MWLLLAGLITSANDNILASKIALVLPLGWIALLLVLVTAFVGGIVGGSRLLDGQFIKKNVLNLPLRNFVHKASVLKIS